jgi:hypothetical protein
MKSKHKHVCAKTAFVCSSSMEIRQITSFHKLLVLQTLFLKMLENNVKKCVYGNFIHPSKSSNGSTAQIGPWTPPLKLLN